MAGTTLGTPSPATPHLSPVACPGAPTALGSVTAAALTKNQVAILQYDANDAPTATMVISPVQALELAEQLRAAAAVASRGAAVYRAEVRT